MADDDMCLADFQAANLAPHHPRRESPVRQVVSQIAASAGGTVSRALWKKRNRCSLSHPVSSLSAVPSQRNFNFVAPIFPIAALSHTLLLCVLLLLCLTPSLLPRTIHRWLRDRLITHWLCCRKPIVLKKRFSPELGQHKVAAVTSVNSCASESSTSA